jgi:hypothetical protein
MTCTFAAAGPLVPCSVSKLTFAPSASVLKPLAWIADWCTNRSLPARQG